MNFWEKLVNDPECGPRSSSPLASAVFGLVLLFFDVNTLVTGAVRVSKTGNGIYIHYSDHPTAFILTCILTTLGAVWGFMNARKRYLMHHG